MPSKMRGRGRGGRPWRRIVAELRRAGLPCAICGHPIDYTLPHNDAMSFTVDHAIPRRMAPWLAEDRANLRPAHRRCNSSDGDRTRTVKRKRISRQW